MTLTICGSVYLVLILLNGFVERDDINDYLNDVTWIVQSLESIRAQNNIAEEGYYRQLDPQLYPFNIRWLPSTSPLVPCNNCQYYGLSDDNIETYRFDDGRVLSVHSVIHGSGIIIQDPLNQLASSFNEMAQQLSETVTENKIFAQAVPHELRTPLSRIQLAAGILRTDCHLPEQQQLLDNIDQYIVDIDQLFSQVITFSQVNTHSTQQHYQEIMLKSLATRISRFTSSATTVIEVNISDDLSVFSEPAYLRLITENLIKNAIDHCRTTIISAPVLRLNHTTITLKL